MRRDKTRRALVFAFCAFAVMPAFAQPPWAKGGGKGDDRDDDRDERGRGSKGGNRFKHLRDEHRVAVREYYAGEFQSSGGCPPGLAKKHNGCMPPGQAKKWQMGQRLPSDVVVYPVPHELEVQ